MKRPRKSPPRPGHNAMSGPRFMPFSGYFPAKVVNRADPSIDSVHVGKKTGRPMRTAEPQFAVRHLTPEESARERLLQTEARSKGQLTKYLKAKAA